MGMGPIVLFDKSFIEMLNLDEATLFDFMFMSNICPIFLTEVLADLEKEKPGERTREKVVADVANKTPVVHSYPNVMHSSLCLSELAGRPVEMDRRPVFGGGQAVRVDGKVGVYHPTSPEMAAFDRWQSGKFFEVEREFARGWRAQLAATDLREAAALARRALAIQSAPRNLQEAYDIAKKSVYGERDRYRIFKAAYTLLGLPPQRWPDLILRWKAAGGPPLATYAPYTAHCLLVDTFFHVAVAKKLISPDRLSNRTDIAYLYYLPFAMIFVSNDNLHRRSAPLFMRADQRFLAGAVLKSDLQALDAHFSAFPADQLEQGLFRFAADPPHDDRFLTTRIYRQFGLTVADRNISLDVKQSQKLGEDIRAMIDRMEREAKKPTSSVGWREADDADHITITRMVPPRRGKWRLMSPEVEQAARMSKTKS
jgi:hypothetical protein